MPLTPAVSISIVLFNTQPDDIRNCLADLKTLAVPTVLTVVDNSPTDALRDLVEKTGTPYIFSGSNRGFGAGHNFVLKQKLADAPYHLVLNPDVRIPAHTVETLVDYLDQNPGVGLVMPKVLNAEGSEQIQARRLPTPLDLIARRLLGSAAQTWEGQLKKDRPIYMPFLSGCFMMLRGSVLAQVGLFDERYFLYMEDVDLSRRVGAVSDTVCYPSVSIYHDHARASYKSFRMLWVHLRSAFQYFNKWGWIGDRKSRQENRRAGSPVGNLSRPHALHKDDPSHSF